MNKHRNADSASARLARCLAVALFAAPLAAFSAPINPIAYASLTGMQFVTFDDVPGGAAPGTNYDAVFVSGGVSFAERLAGQTNTPAGGFDVLSGTPTGPLGLVVGAPGQNLNVFITGGSQVLTGLGPAGFPDFNAIGEGSIAMVFTTDQSEFGFQLVGGNGGQATVDFFRRDGSLVDSIVISGLADAFYGFSREGGVNDIAGISIFTNDPAGIGFDNLRFDVPSGEPTVPEPASIALIGAALAALGLSRRRRT